MVTFDPITIVSIIVLQIANRYMKFDFTTAQEKIIMNPYTQFIMYMCVVYFTTKNVLFTAVVALLTYIFATILFNENHKLNILPKAWLYKENIISEEPESTKQKYMESLTKYHA